MTDDTGTQETINDLSSLKDKTDQGISLGSWWVWTIEQFNDWCDGPSGVLMKDAEIDALTSLSVKLRTNIKSINAFIRHSGKMLIVARDVIKWLIRKII